VTAGQTVRQSFTLQVGQVSENITVSESAPLVQTGEPSQAGQIVITEFMKDPSTVSDARGEWIEVYNAMPWRVNLEGWILSDTAARSTCG